MCSESNHLSPNDFFSLLAYGILRILKKYTAYCLMNHHPCMQNASNQFHQKVVCKYNKDEMLLYSVGQTIGSTLLKHQRRGSPKEICNSLHACNGIPCPKNTEI